MYLRNNKIESLNEIFYLKELKNLKILWLDENPCTQSENYRLNVIKNLTSLEYLDNIGNFYQKFIKIFFYKKKVISEEETKEAIETGQDFCFPPDSIEDDKLITTESLNLSSEDNSYNPLKSTNETENNNLETHDNSIIENIKEPLIIENQEKDKVINLQYLINPILIFSIQKSNVLSAILILLNNLNFNELNQVIQECEKLKNL